MGILEKVTSSYKEFQEKESVKIFFSDYRVFRGLECPRVVVVLDRNLRGLEQYLPECLNRCATYLHAILLHETTHMLKQAQHEGTTLQEIITTWKKQYNNKILINSWRVDICCSIPNNASDEFYKKRNLEVIEIYSTSKKYKKLEENFRKLQNVEN